MKKFLAIVCLAVGVAICAASLGFLPVDDVASGAPRWVVGLAGGALIVGGFTILARDHGGSDTLASIALLSLSAFGAWLIFFSPEGTLEGGIPFLLPSVNEAMGRLLFGFGGVLCALMAWWALRRLLR